CLVTTLTMPTGWWVIGRSPFRFLRPEAEDAFPLAVGDRVRFLRISHDEYHRQAAGGPKEPS
ncbi:MAG TPA: allophanate hydrolase subunit 1, partial [Chromatiales bacterium]|nr:allophanate hydrolase subunit 1 [Chromatiales bacterium]